jgi:PAS domain-containing protein
MGAAKAVIEIAHRMVEDYGDHAGEHIDQRAKQCEREGDLEAARLWLRVGQAAKELKRSGTFEVLTSAPVAPRTLLDEAAFRRAFEASPHSYLLLTPDLRIAAANDAYLNAIFVRRNDIIGRPLFDVLPDNPELAPSNGPRNLRASLERVIELGVTDRLAVQRYDIKRPDGMFEERWWATLNVPALDDDGRLLFVIHHLDDVTARVIRADG